MSHAVDTTALRNRLESLNPVLHKVERLRHKRAAHSEMNAAVPTVVWDELNPLLVEIQGIVRETSILSISTDLLFNTPGSSHIIELMARLSE